MSSLAQQQIREYDEQWHVDHDTTVERWDHEVGGLFDAEDSRSNIYFFDGTHGWMKKLIDEERPVDVIHYVVHDLIERQEETGRAFLLEWEAFGLIASLALREVIRWVFYRGDADYHFKPEWWKSHDVIDEVERIRSLMIRKNREYGSSWSIMRASDIAGILHTKTHRATELSSNIDDPNFESLEDTYRDLFNYCIFALIRLSMEGGERCED